jgi:hypothetical protein
VALLDDGAKLTDLHGIQIGASFCPDDEPYFVGPCSHGTSMAKCIRDVCPMAELYIARLDVSRKEENQKFTVRSAVKVSFSRKDFAKHWGAKLFPRLWSGQWRRK